MKFKIGDKVRISKRILTIDYSEGWMDEPTPEMKRLVGRIGEVVRVYRASAEYELDILRDVTWMEQELDVVAINKGRE